MSGNKILVAGASGYIGSRLIPSLLQQGYRVKAGGRSLKILERRVWARHPNVELVTMDMFDEESIKCAVDGCASAFYFVHSMNPKEKNFMQADRVAAQNMANASQKVGLKRIIYLGGLGERGEHSSKHLKSRAEVSEILHASNIPTTTLRAAVILGAGSVAYEILGYLVKRLPIMITPRWVSTENQPLAITNIIRYLTGVLEKDETIGEIYDVGGPQILTYKELMRIYAQAAGLKARFIIPVPILSPRLSSYWINFITPIDGALARPLAEGLKNRVVCHDHRIKTIIPQILLTPEIAIRRALGLENLESIRIVGSNEIYPPIEVKNPGDPSWVSESNGKK